MPSVSSLTTCRYIHLNLFITPLLHSICHSCSGLRPFSALLQLEHMRNLPLLMSTAYSGQLARASLSAYYACCASARSVACRVWGLTQPVWSDPTVCLGSPDWLPRYQTTCFPNLLVVLRGNKLMYVLFLSRAYTRSTIRRMSGHEFQLLWNQWNTSFTFTDAKRDADSHLCAHLWPHNLPTGWLLQNQSNVSIGVFF